MGLWAYLDLKRAKRNRPVSQNRATERTSCLETAIQMGLEGVTISELWESMYTPQSFDKPKAIPQVARPRQRWTRDPTQGLHETPHTRLFSGIRFPYFWRLGSDLFAVRPKSTFLALGLLLCCHEAQKYTLLPGHTQQPST